MINSLSERSPKRIQRVTSFECYTDGACSNEKGVKGITKERVGGWGWYGKLKFIDADEPCPTQMIFQDYGGEMYTTAQNMELTAGLEALRFCLDFKLKGDVSIHSDSTYFVKGVCGEFITKDLLQSEPMKVEYPLKGWLKGWLKDTTRETSKGYSPQVWGGKERTNGKEWWEIHNLLKEMIKNGVSVTFVWVRGHSGNEGNEIADKLSNLFASERSRI